MTPSVQQSLKRFVNKFFECAAKKGHVPSVEFDADWPSPCYKATAKDGERVPWQPVQRDPEMHFSGVEKALDITIHPDFATYYACYYSFHLPAQAQQGRCELLQVCSDEDLERLKENIIGHLMMKQRLKQAPTLFFAVTDDDDYIISLHNESGEVMLERVGKEPEQVLAPNLSAFIDGLEPATE